jgi:uncharacterized protein (DUF302 family)
MHIPSPYGYIRSVTVDYDTALARLEQSLADEGFGVLCRIDMQAKLKEKLGVEFPRYVQLGACNPALAEQALRRDLALGLLLPCPAAVYEADGRTYLAAVDAVRRLTGGAAAPDPVLEALARDINLRLQRAVDRAASGR